MTAKQGQEDETSEARNDINENGWSEIVTVQTFASQRCSATHRVSAVTSLVFSIADEAALDSTLEKTFPSLGMQPAAAVAADIRTILREDRAATHVLLDTPRPNRLTFIVTFAHD